jgi:hypothetical protein
VDFGARVGEASKAERPTRRKRRKTKMEKQKQHDLDSNELEALRFAAQAARSITTLEVGRKAINRIYAGRIKSLRSIAMMIQQQDQLGQLKIDGMNCINLEPKLKRLVYDPTGDMI